MRRCGCRHKGHSHMWRSEKHQDYVTTTSERGVFLFLLLLYSRAGSFLVTLTCPPPASQDPKCVSPSRSCFSDILASNSSCQHEDPGAGTFTCWALAGHSLPFLLELIVLSREADFADVPVPWMELPALG